MLHLHYTVHFCCVCHCLHCGSASVQIKWCCLFGLLQNVWSILFSTDEEEKKLCVQWPKWREEEEYMKYLKLSRRAERERNEEKIESSVKCWNERRGQLLKPAERNNQCMKSMTSSTLKVWLYLKLKWNEREMKSEEDIQENCAVKSWRSLKKTRKRDDYLLLSLFCLVKWRSIFSIYNEEEKALSNEKENMKPNEEKSLKKMRRNSDWRNTISHHVKILSLSMSSKAENENKSRRKIHGAIKLREALQAAQRRNMKWRQYRNQRKRHIKQCGEGLSLRKADEERKSEMKLKHHAKACRRIRYWRSVKCWLYLEGRLSLKRRRRRRRREWKLSDSAKIKGI